MPKFDFNKVANQIDENFRTAFYEDTYGRLLLNIFINT